MLLFRMLRRCEGIFFFVKGVEMEKEQGVAAELQPTHYDQCVPQMNWSVRENQGWVQQPGDIHGGSLLPQRCLSG